ncbi:hypothetical protein ACIHFB_18570 [Streptomyces sp. NPDC051963]|uniref:hypothetical protein n=1 Tax=Streptomyces sp. NPDC051963 TaxID=3365678 RepID=UPI0037D2B96F
MAVQKDGTLTWAYVPVKPSYAGALTGASPTSTGSTGLRAVLSALPWFLSGLVRIPTGRWGCSAAAGPRPPW